MPPRFQSVQGALTFSERSLGVLPYPSAWVFVKQLRKAATDSQRRRKETGQQYLHTHMSSEGESSVPFLRKKAWDNVLISTCRSNSEALNQWICALLAAPLRPPTRQLVQAGYCLFHCRLPFPWFDRPILPR